MCTSYLFFDKCDTKKSERPENNRKKTFVIKNKKLKINK